VQGRPITGNQRWITQPLAELVAHLVQPYVVATPVFTQDSDQINRELNDFSVGKDDLIITYDIVRLYPSIPHELCFVLLQRHLTAQGCRYTDFIIAALRIILNRNYCNFNGQTWRQFIGFATGISCGAEIANLFIYVLTRFVFRQYDQHISLHRRFIDDGFILWSGTKDAALAMFAELNALNSNIQLTYEISALMAIFLDIFVFKGDRFKRLGYLDTKTYQKPMNKYLYTPFNTEAPRACKLSIVHTELRRYIKRSSARADYIDIASAFRQRLCARGFPSWFLQLAFRSGPSYKNRQKFLADKSAAVEDAANKPAIVFATKYSQTLQESGLSRAIFLNQSYLPSYILEQVEFLTAWRAARKLGAKLICYDFSKVSDETDTEVRSDSPDQGDSTTVYPLQQSNLQVSRPPLSDNISTSDGQETHGSPPAANTNSSLATLMRLLESRN
jgi:hypothetical protein